MLQMVQSGFWETLWAPRRTHLLVLWIAFRKCAIQQVTNELLLEPWLGTLMMMQKGGGSLRFVKPKRLGLYWLWPAIWIVSRRLQIHWCNKQSATAIEVFCGTFGSEQMLYPTLLLVAPSDFLPYQILTFVIFVQSINPQAKHWCPLNGGNSTFATEKFQPKCGVYFHWKAHFGSIVPLTPMLALVSYSCWIFLCHFGDAACVLRALLRCEVFLLLHYLLGVTILLRNGGYGSWSHVKQVWKIFFFILKKEMEQVASSIFQAIPQVKVSQWLLG